MQRRVFTVIYYIDMRVSLVKLILNYIRDSSVIFYISSLCACIHWCMFETSSSLPLRSLAIFGNFRKRQGLVMFVWPSEQFWKIFGNLRKIFKNAGSHQYVYIIKRTLRISSKIWILCSRGKSNISLVCWAHSWDIVFAPQT